MPIVARAVLMFDRLHEAMSTVLMRDRGLAFYAAQKLGKTRYLTPEGYLVCEGVPIARTGEQTYRQDELNRGGEIKIRGNSDGIVVVKREPEDVFHPDTMRSFEGKAITIEHPSQFLSPDTIKLHQVGHVQHVRRGVGIEDDLLVGDFVITDPEAIAYANRDLPEVSAGYVANYEQTQAGVAYQRNIFGNHVALVERGRAGPRVSIKDSLKEFSTMAKKANTADRLLSPIDDGKQLVLGTVWEGGLSPRIDKLKDEIKQLVTGFTIGQVLHAESPEPTLDLGEVWTGLEHLERAVAKVKRATGSTRTGDARSADQRSRAIYDPRQAPAVCRQFGRATSPAELNEASRKFWKRQTTTADGASDQRTLTHSRATSIADINARNREFWAGR